jgi:hypothetical protein
MSFCICTDGAGATGAGWICVRTCETFGSNGLASAVSRSFRMSAACASVLVSATRPASFCSAAALALRSALSLASSGRFFHSSTSAESAFLPCSSSASTSSRTRPVLGLSAPLLRRDRLHELVEVGLAVLERIDVEAEARQRAGHALEVAGRSDVFGLAEALDLDRAGRERRRRAILVEDRQRAEHLPDRLVECRELRALRLVAEERVERLLDRAQGRLDLGDDLRHQQAFLRAARHLVKHRDRRGLLQRLALHDGLQPQVH